MTITTAILLIIGLVFIKWTIEVLWWVIRDISILTWLIILGVFGVFLLLN